MIIRTGIFKTANGKKDHYRIGNFTQLTGTEATAIRNEIGSFLMSDLTTVYVDAKDATEADLSGINEIIHTNYTVRKADKKMILIYRRNSVIEKWVETTGLEKFIHTAILPAL